MYPFDLESHQNVRACAAPATAKLTAEYIFKSINIQKMVKPRLRLLVCHGKLIYFPMLATNLFLPSKDAH